MINKDFQKVLAQFPDDYQICIDNVFGWEPISSHNMVDPHLYVNTDIGQIEIEPSDGYREIWHKYPDEIPSCECTTSRFLTVVNEVFNSAYLILNIWDGFKWSYSNDYVSRWMEVPDWNINAE